MKPVKGPMISKKGVCPSMQFARLTTRSKGNEACEKLDDLKEGGMP